MSLSEPLLDSHVHADRNSAPGDPPRIDKTQIEYLQKSFGSQGLAEIVQLFDRDARIKVSGIVNANEQDRRCKVGTGAHSLKSSAAMLGCISLAELLSLIEKEAGKDNSQNLDSLVRQLPEILDQTLSVLS